MPMSRLSEVSERCWVPRSLGNKFGSCHCGLMPMDRCMKVFESLDCQDLSSMILFVFDPIHFESGNIVQPRGPALHPAKTLTNQRKIDQGSIKDNISPQPSPKAKVPSVEYSCTRKVVKWHALAHGLDLSSVFEIGIGSL